MARRARATAPGKEGRLTLLCKTLLLLCGGLPHEEDEYELVQVRAATGELNGGRIDLVL